MKKIFNFLIVVVIMLFVFNGCKDRTDLTAPPAPSAKSGNADFTRFVTIGNSLTAGYQSSALFESAQKYSFGSQIAKQMGVEFAQPLVSDPGLGGQLMIKSLEPFVLTAAPVDAGTPLNAKYPAPYNNLGVPDAFVYDILNATNSKDCYTALYANDPNPLFDLVLRGQGTIFDQAKALHPTFLTVWIGNNDILGYATRGGTIAYTPVNNFAYLYSTLMDSIATLKSQFGTNVVVGNIPNVGAIPFFTTVGPQVAMGTPWSSLKLIGVQGLVYQKNGNTGIGDGLADSTQLLTGGVLLTLPGASYAPLIGKPTGKFYRDNHYPALPPGIDTTKPFGFHPQNPWPDALILDPDEIATVHSTVNSYNQTISTTASAHGFGVVDFHSFFNNVRLHDFSGGTYFNGVKFTTTFVEGGIFGLDGVHPTNQGYAIVANEFIKVINSKFNANIPLIDVSTVSGSIQFAKRTVNKLGLPYFTPGSFDNRFYF